MKARNPSTGNLETVYVKALDSMPVGTQIEFTGDTIPTGWEEVNDYSTTEIDTGKKWIDGSTIYRKVFDITSPNVLTTTKVCEAPAGSTIINYWGYIEGNYNARYPLNVNFSSSDFVYSYVADGNGINLRIGLDAYKNKPMKVVLEYTKSS